MADDSLHKSFDIMKLPITALMLDLVSLKLVVAEEGFEQFAGVHPILKIIIIHINCLRYCSAITTATLSGRIVSISP